MATTTIRCFVNLTNGSATVTLTPGNIGNNGISLAAPNVIEDMLLVVASPTNATRFVKGSTGINSLELQEPWSGGTLVGAEVRIATSGAAVANLTAAVREVINQHQAADADLHTAVTSAQDSATAAALSAVGIGNQLLAATASAQAASDAEAIAITKAGVATEKADAAAMNASTAVTNAEITVIKAAEAHASVQAADVSAVQAAAARDLAISAWAVSTAPGETLAAINQSIHVGTIVKVLIDDTSKHSDGGAWRKRCADKSWFTEMLGGDRWLPGSYATIAAAWSAAGSATGAVFQANATAGPLTIGRMYAATSATTATEVFRGISREYPAVIAWVAESGRVVGYDLSKPGAPMWIVFKATSLSMWWGSASVISSLAIFDGSLTVSSATDGTRLVNFITDTMGIGYSVAVTAPTGGISGRNATPVWGGVRNYAIVNNIVNDIAVTVLEGSPTDPATGLPTPTVAVACGTHGSLIKHDGTAITLTGLYADYNIAFDESNNCVSFGENSRNYRKALYPSYTTIQYITGGGLGLQQAVFIGSGVNAGLVNKSTKALRLNAGGIALFKEMPSAVNNSMAACITNAYNSGWQVGNSVGAWLADTVVETITSTAELVANGTFATDLSGWATGTSFTSTAAAVAGEMQVTATTNFGRQIYSVATVVGKTYSVSADLRIVSGSSNCYLSVAKSGELDDVTSPAGGVTATTLTNRTLSFTATATTSKICCAVNSIGSVGAFDNVSCKLTEPDRSVKNNGVFVVGSLVKSVVAPNAALIAYSGFSGSNYFEQLYNANLDFGIGDFCVMGWACNAAAVTNHIYLKRTDKTGATHTTGPGFWLGTNASGCPSFTIFDGTISATAAGTTALFGAFVFLCGVRRGAVLDIYANGLLAGTIACSAATMSNISAVLQIGAGYYNGTTYGYASSLALVRISATAPSADQIAWIYRTEKPLFQPFAQCTIAGSSTAVTAMAYDATTELLHVGTSWGQTYFRGLQRVYSEPTSVGAITTLSASQGAVLTGGLSGAQVTTPAFGVREQVLRNRNRRNNRTVFIPLTAQAGGQSDFYAPAGYDIKAVYINEALKTLGSSYSLLNDGFKVCAHTFAVQSAGTIVQLVCEVSL